MGIVKILILLAIVLAIYMLFRSKRGVSANKQEEQKAVEMKLDPICKTYVEDNTDFKVKLYDDIYYFCSDECKQKFIKSKSK